LIFFGQILFDETFGALNGKNVPLLESITNVFRNLKYYFSNPLYFVLMAISKTYRISKFRKLIEPQNQIIRYYLEKRRNDPNRDQKHDILNLILNAQDDESEYKMSELDLQSTLRVLVIAGYETTAHSLSWFLYCLSIYPEYQKKLQNEVDSILGNEKLPTPNHLGEMKLLTCFIFESMRMFPVVPFGGQRLLAEDTTLSGYAIPKGTEVWVDTYSVHRNPKYWDNPNEFFPERFEKPTPAFMPYTIGPRNCIGQTLANYEMKAIGAAIIKNFIVKLAPGCTVEPQDLVTLRPKNCLLIFESR